MGVYIKTMNKVYFRKLDKLYETDDFVISRTYYDNKEGYLELYDDVIVKGKDLYCLLYTSISPSRKWMKSCSK